MTKNLNHEYPQQALDDSHGQEYRATTSIDRVFVKKKKPLHPVRIVSRVSTARLYTFQWARLVLLLGKPTINTTIQTCNLFIETQNVHVFPKLPSTEKRRTDFPRAGVHTAVKPPPLRPITHTWSNHIHT